MFYVYTKDDCGFCTRLVEVLEGRNIQYEKFLLDKDFTRDQFYGQFGRGATFPQTVVDGRVVGGLKETAQYIAKSK